MNIDDMMAPEPVDYNDGIVPRMIHWINKHTAVHDIEALMEGVNHAKNGINTMKFLINLSKEDFPMMDALLGFCSNTENLEPVFMESPTRAARHVARLVQNLPHEFDQSELIQNLLTLIPSTVTQIEILQHCLPSTLVRELLGFLDHCQVCKIFRLSEN